MERAARPASLDPIAPPPEAPFPGRRTGRDEIPERLLREWEFGVAEDDAGTGIGYEPNLAMLPGLEPERRACRNVEAQAGIEIAVDAARFLDQIDPARNSALARGEESGRFFGNQILFVSA